jgi:hypothetical protein
MDEKNCCMLNTALTLATLIVLIGYIAHQKEKTHNEQDRTPQKIECTDKGYDNPSKPPNIPHKKDTKRKIDVSSQRYSSQEAENCCGRRGDRLPSRDEFMNLKREYPKSIECLWTSSFRGDRGKDNNREFYEPKNGGCITQPEREGHQCHVVCFNEINDAMK